jgi:hypothetical protein
MPFSANLFVQAPKPVFAGHPFALSAVIDPAPVFALRKFGRQICDEWSPQYLL